MDNGFLNTVEVFITTTLMDPSQFKGYEIPGQIGNLKGI